MQINWIAVSLNEFNLVLYLRSWSVKVDADLSEQRDERN